MMITVVLCTYNGEKYLTELLDSLMRQTVCFDELIVSDDGSTDNTLSIIRDYIEKFSNIKLIENSGTKGASFNFVNTVKQASGDIVFFCDQDDVWIDDKIEVMSNIILNNKDINLLASSLAPLYEGKIFSPSMLAVSKQSTNGKFLRINLEASNFNIKRSGCTMCFKKVFFDEIVDVWEKGWYHDDFIWKCAVFNNTAAVINKLTVLRRIHDNNASISIKRTIENRVRNILDEIYYSKLAYLTVESRDSDGKIKSELQKFIIFQENRLDAIVNRSFMTMIYNMFFYYKLYRSMPQMLLDLIFLLKIKKYTKMC